MTLPSGPRAILGFFALAAVLIAGPAISAQQQAGATTGTGDASTAGASAAPASADLASVIKKGETEYMKNCRPCHGSDGAAGVPLAGNEKIAAGPGYLIWAILTGPGYMPEFGPKLSDATIAEIATFIENSWGNSNGLVTPEDVKLAR